MWTVNNVELKKKRITYNDSIVKQKKKMEKKTKSKENKKNERNNRETSASNMNMSMNSEHKPYIKHTMF